MNWEQLKTILWLRWRLTRNQWQRAGGFGAVLAVIVAVSAVALGAATFVGGLIGAALGLGDAKPVVVMGIWLGVTAAFLFFWLIGLLAELQRSETIDLQRLMHLPVALGQMFVINYVASHLALSIILMVPAMTGLALGLTFSRGPAMLLLLPLAWSMVFMISAWTYCLRGWLATMMSNPRRRRAIIMGITLAFILIFQLPNLYFNVFGGRKRFDRPKGATPEEVQRDRAAREARDKANVSQLIEVQKFIPPLWLPYGALGLAEHRVLPALLGTLGCLGLGALGLRRAYRSTVKFYQGETGGQAAAPRSSVSHQRERFARQSRQVPAGTPPALCARAGRRRGAGHVSFDAPRAGSKDGLGNGVHRDSDPRRVGVLARRAENPGRRQAIHRRGRDGVFAFHAGAVSREPVRI